MPLSKRLLTTLSVSAFTFANIFAQTFAPAPPPILSSDAKVAKTSGPEIAAAAGTQFSVGDPTDEEQLHLELINRARADASAEALRLIALSQVDKEVGNQFRFWQVDTNLLKAQFATNPPAPPLSFNAKLMSSSLGHSQFQFDNAIQTHTGTNGSSLVDRVKAVNYAWANLGENVFTEAQSPEHGHAAFEVDWGPGPGGMQSPPGHRISIHFGQFNEIGIGIVKGFNTVNGNTVGPQVVTEDFGRSLAATTYITGVAYYDLNGNNFYDLGEGLPGVRVTVDGVSTFAVTTTSGAYSIPVPPNHGYTVRFNLSGGAEVTKAATVGSDNVKVDFTPTYTPPTATLDGPLNSGEPKIVNLSPLPGATGYRARITQLIAPSVEGAEGTQGNLNMTTTPGYSAISTTVKASGAASFRLGHLPDPADGNVHAQAIEFKDAFFVGANARIDFLSRMGIATPIQVGFLQVSTGGGATWNTIWSQPGADQPGETSFSAKSASLADYAGKSVHVRFFYDLVANGSYYPVTAGASVGWYFDDVTFVNAQQSLGLVETPVVTAPNVSVTPGVPGNYLLEVQAIDGARTFPYGPPQQFTVSQAAPSVTLSQDIAASPAAMTLTFTANTTGLFTIQSSGSINGPWATDPTAVVTGPVQGVFTVTIPRNGPQQFYRVAATF